MTGYVPTLPEGCNLIALQTIGSTNDHAKTLARNGYPSGTVVWAKEQTAGRGRHGNAWTSIPGNLFMTLILRPQVNATLTGQLSFLSAVALARVLRPLLPEGAEMALKWPNDVLINGKKAAGILLETEVTGVRPVDWVIVGIGVNIVDAPENAISLKNLRVEGVEAGQVLEKLATEIMSLYRAWKKDGFAAVREEWLQNACKLGEIITVRLPQGAFSATFLGIDPSGAMQMEMPDGTKKTITSGEVFTG